MSIDAAVQSSANSGAPFVSVPWERVERFVGQLSHDLRNGLNACELQLTFLAEISTDPDAVEEVKGLKSTLAGINKQLQAIRSSTATVKTHPLDYPAEDLFEDLRERFGRTQPTTDRVEWVCEVPGGVAVNVDPEVTLNALLELLGNALHFADEGTPVRCRLGTENAAFVCVVGETLAVPPTALESWGRSPLDSTRRGAYGLGLFRARRGLEAQGSRLEFNYLPDEQTLLATVTLPAASVTPPAP